MNLRNTSILKKASISIVAALLIISCYIYFSQKPIPPKAQDPAIPQVEVRQKPLEKALTVSDENMLSVSQFEKIVSEHSNAISRVFFRISSGVAFSCDSLVQKCDLKNSNRSNLDLSKYGSILKKHSIPAVLIYDLNINNYAYRFEKFKPVEVDAKAIKKQEGLAKAKVVFSVSNSQQAIEKDFKSKLNSMEFEKIIFGSDLNFFFYSIFGTKTREGEIKSFWSLVHKIKSENPSIPVSSSFNFEHMKYYNFWSELGRLELEQLDFISFSSHPLHPGWGSFPKYAEQLYGFTAERIGETDYNYFTVLRQKLNPAKDIYLVDFGYPEDESKEQNRMLLIKHIEKNPIIACLSWTLLPAETGDAVDIKYKNALSLFDVNANLNESGKLFFSSNK